MASWLGFNLQLKTLMTIVLSKFLNFIRLQEVATQERLERQTEQVVERSTSFVIERVAEQVVESEEPVVHWVWDKDWPATMEIIYDNVFPSYSDED